MPPGARAGPAARRKRLCCTVSHLPGQPPRPRWPLAAAGPLGLALRKRYRSGPPWRVTRKWRPGGVSPGGDRSPEGATGPAGGWCQEIRPSWRARGLGPVGGAERLRRIRQALQGGQDLPPPAVSLPAPEQPVHRLPRPVPTRPGSVCLDGCPAFWAEEWAALGDGAPDGSFTCAVFKRPGCRLPVRWRRAWVAAPAQSAGAGQLPTACTSGRFPRGWQLYTGRTCSPSPAPCRRWVRWWLQITRFWALSLLAHQTRGSMQIGGDACLN
jgi:hypothetical protein